MKKNQILKNSGGGGRDIQLTREMVDFLYWAGRNIITEKNEALDFNQHCFLMDIYRWTGKKGETVVIKKGAQVGVSTWAISLTLWLMSHYPVTVIYTLPTGVDASEFSQTRFNPMISKIKAFSFIKIDNVSVKQISSSYLFLRGTWTEREAISVPSDMNIYDEVDRSRMDIIEAYKERLSASFIQWQIYISTPTIPGYGISKLYDESDKREWFVRCKRCNNEDTIKIENIIDGEFRCLKCKEILDRTQGRWVKTGNGTIKGYHIHQGIAPWITAREILEKQEKYTIKRDYFNFVWGQEYAGGDEAVNRLDIMSIIVDGIPAGVRTVIGVDWGDETWVVVRRENTVIYIEKITGDTRTHWQRVLQLAEKFNGMVVADWGYGDIKNAEIADRIKTRFYACQYKEGQIPEKIGQEKGNIRVIQVDRTRSIEETIDEIKRGKNDEKGVALVSGPMIETLIRHFMNIKASRTSDRYHKERVIFERVGPDHLVHAWNYARLGVKVLGRMRAHIRVVG